MDILIDTNVLINFITDRDDPYLESSNKIMEMCSDKVFQGHMAFHSFSSIWYILRRELGVQKTRYWLDELNNMLHIADASQEQVMDAIRNLQFADFEDCLQDECARKVHADYLVTCNVKDYRHAKSRVVSPDALVRILTQMREEP